MKTFKDLKLDDNIYIVNRDDTKVSLGVIRGIRYTNYNDIEIWVKLQDEDGYFCYNHLDKVDPNKYSEMDTGLLYTTDKNEAIEFANKNKDIKRKQLLERIENIKKQLENL